MTDLSSFPARRRGNFFEAFEPGRVFDHHWGKTVTAGDASLFASITHAYNPLHFNAETARAEGHPTSSSAPCSCSASWSASASRT
jgi:itaconyl-CoA hydratase